MTQNVRHCNTYNLHRNDPQDLAVLLTAALTDRVPLVVIATDEMTGAIARREGYVTDATPDRVVMRTGDGGQFRCRRWEIDRAALIEEVWAAA